MDTPVIYGPDEEFPIGGCKVLRQSEADRATLVAAGVTVHEALAAYEHLKQQGIAVGVIDLYCIKPVDEETLRHAAAASKLLITVEDHYPEGGLGEAVRSALWDVAGDGGKPCGPQETEKRQARRTAGFRGNLRPGHRR